MVETKRKLHLEAIRVIALVCIVFNHSGDRGNNLYLYTNGNITFILSLIGDILCKMGVPLFLMVSGALLLNKEESWQSIYCKRAFRIVKVIILFNTIRYFYECFLVKEITFSVIDLVKLIFTGSLFVPYWFLYTYLSILLVLPFLKKMMQSLDRKEMHILIELIFLFYAVLPVVTSIFNINFEITFMFGSSYCCFVLGYYFEHLVEKSAYTEKNVILAILFVIGSVAFTYWIITRNRVTMGVIESEHTSVLAIVIASCIFFIVKAMWQEEKIRFPFLDKSIMVVGNCSFGIYLIEDYLRNGLSFIYDNIAVYTTVLPACVVWLSVVIVVGVIIISFMKKIPGLKNVI